MEKLQRGSGNGRIARQLQQDRRRKGLCIYCGQPAIKSTDRAMDVNRRLAAGRGLAAEYHVATKGRWTPGDPPPTLEYLTHEGLCAQCKQRHSDRSSQLQAREREKAARLRRNEEKRHDIYANRIRRGICGRCGKRPKSTTANTVECDVCYNRRFTRALASPHAADVTKWLKAGESQASIRANHGISGQVVQPIAMLLRSRGEIPSTPPRRPTRSASTNAATGPMAPTPKADKTHPPQAEPEGRTNAGATPHRKRANYRADIKSIARRLREGQSLTRTAEAFGVSPRTLGRWLKAAGITVPKTGTRHANERPDPAARRENPEPGAHAHRPAPPRERG